MVAVRTQDSSKNGCLQGPGYLPSPPLTWLLTEGPLQSRLIFQVPNHRCHVSWRKGRKWLVGSPFGFKNLPKRGDLLRMGKVHFAPGRQLIVLTRFICHWCEVDFVHGNKT